MFANKGSEAHCKKKIYAKKGTGSLETHHPISGQTNGEPNDNNWDWTTPEITVEEQNAPHDDIANLKDAIKQLENERNHLLDQLEQLDIENQQNLSELVKIREKLQDENTELRDKNAQLKQQNRSLVSKEEKLNKIIENLEAKAPTKQNGVPEELEAKLEQATKELAVFQSVNETLQKTLENTKKGFETELSEVLQKLKKSELDTKAMHSELQAAEQFVEAAEVKRQADAENCQKLEFILESYEKQVTTLKSELANIKNVKEPDSAIEKLCQQLQVDLNTASQNVANLENQKAKLIADLELHESEFKHKLEQLELQLKVKTEELSSLKMHTNINSPETGINSPYQDQISKLQEQNKALQQELENFNQAWDSMHVMYINTIHNFISKHIDPSVIPGEPSPDFFAGEDPQLTEFINKIDNIFKILLEYKEKCESLEKALMEASNEKTNILNEKYTEIEKLIQNSEILSEEVIKKGETIKEFESEVSQLIESNDLLLSELDSYKTSNLQTISESNEDSMILLENCLENANKRIEELEDIIDTGKKTENEIADTSIEDKVAKKQDDYQELLNSFDELKLDYDEVAEKLKKANEKVRLVEADNEELKTALDKIKGEFENTDYQLSEANIYIESLKEELTTAEAEARKLHQENAEHRTYDMNHIDAKEQLNEIKEKWINEESLRRDLESQVKNLTERLQNLKVTETSLKLQYDTLQKEYAANEEAKGNLEQSLASAKTSITDYENNYTELLQKYDAILLRCEELSTLLHEKDIEIINIKGLEEQNRKLEQLAKDNSVKLELCETVPQLIAEKDVQIANSLARVRELELESAALQGLAVEQKEEIAGLERRSKELQDLVEQTRAGLLAKDEHLIELKNRLENVEQHNRKLELDSVENSINSEIKLSPNEHSIEPIDDKNKALQDEILALQTALTQSQQSNEVLQQQLLELGNSRNELINMITIKHQESLSYHNEIQRLSQILTSEADKFKQLEAKLVQAGEASDEMAKKNEEIDKLLDQNNFLKEKCDVLTKNLLEEQSKLQQLIAEKSVPSDKEISLLKQLERLQSHLMEQEERYTQELLQAEQKSSQLRAKLTDLEQREKNSSTMYTSVSIRANQQVETLQNQLQMVTNQRDDLRKKISDLEDFNNKQAAGLANLQFVLEQFQKGNLNINLIIDKEKDVLKETERIRRQISTEKQVQNELRAEINSLKGQLEESKIGLQAASRLSDQLELLKKQNSGLKDEVSQLQQKLSKTQQAIHDLTSQTDGKIDKSLIKSLLVGFLSSGNSSNWNKDQSQVLKLIATVLDFNQQDHDKVKLNKPQSGSWLSSILSPQSNNSNMSHESLSQAFVKFLENESRPRVVPSLLSEEPNNHNSSTESSKRNTPSASPAPIVLNEVFLPTFADFGQSRNSSSILKDVLKDNNR
ncbi:hypothetical protein YQE_02739, partial [Dendroctonus ponderosae]